MGKAITTISDLRTVGEAEVFSGPQSQLALPGGISAGPGATVSITGAAPVETGKTFEQMLDATQSTLGKVLGLTSQLASSVFAQTPTGREAVATLTAPSLAAQAQGVSSYPAAMILVGLIILLLLAGSRK